MTLQELKTSLLVESGQDIENESLLDKTIHLVLDCADETFLANQYIDELCKIRMLTRQTIEDVSEIQRSSTTFLINQAEFLYIMYTEDLSTFTANIDSLPNLVIICTKPTKGEKVAKGNRIPENLETYVVKIPKLTDWQLIAYFKVYCSGLSDDDYTFLCNAVHQSAYAAINELDKLRLYPEAERHTVLAAMRNAEDNYLTQFTTFELTDAIIKKDKLTLNRLLYHKHNCDFDPIYIMSILITSFKNMLLLGFKGGASESDLKIKSGAAYHARQNAKLYTEAELRSKLKFLVDLDAKIKLGKLDMPQNCQLSYLLAHLVKVS